MSFICSIFRFCCPCFFSKEIPTKKRSKSPRRSRKTPQLATDDWMRQTSKVTPDQIQDKYLTKVYTVPDPETGFKTVEQCISAHGFKVEFSYKNRLGDSGHVYKAVMIANGTEVACKRIDLSGEANFQDPRKFRYLKRELYILAHGLRHENIIHMINHFIVADDDRKVQFCYIFMELAEIGTLAHKLISDSGHGRKRAVPLSENSAKFYFKQIVNGMTFLHKQNIAHKDLKLTNILIMITEDKRELIKISDFGLSGVRYDSEEKRILKEVHYYGTVFYMPPQVFKLYIYEEHKEKVSDLIKVDPYKADIWSLGVCLFVMVCGVYPFGISKDFFEPSFGDSIENQRVIYNCMRERKFTINVDIKDRISTDCIDLIDELLEPDKDRRPDIQTVSHHKWLN